MNNLGIDYGLGQTNIDTKTGIRYGVISQHSVGEAWFDEAEADYGEAHCPKCGNEASEYPTEDYQDHHAFSLADIENDFDNDRGYNDYICYDCKYVFDSQDAFPEEALGYYIDNDEYKLTDCLDSDIMVIKSPYYTFAQYCSPCVLGACSLNSPMDNGVKCYCLGHDWFEEGIAPYPVYAIEDDRIVIAENKE